MPSAFAPFDIEALVPEIADDFKSYIVPGTGTLLQAGGGPDVNGEYARTVYQYTVNPSETWETSGLVLEQTSVFSGNFGAYDPHFGGNEVEVVGGSCVRKSNLPPDQWVTSQCVIPLDGQPLVAPGVRMGPAGAYFLGNMGSAEPPGFQVFLVRGHPTNPATLATWSFEGTTNDYFCEGYTESDDFWAILEARTMPDGVHLRCTLANHMSQLETGPFPRFVARGRTGRYGLKHLGEIVDNSPYRVLTGQPGLSGGSVNAAGGAIGFYAGRVRPPLEVASVSPSSGPLAGGTRVRITHNRGI